MKEKLEIKPAEQKPAAEGEPRPEGREESSAEVPETVVEEPRVERSWQEILIQAKEEFPEEITRIIDKDSQGAKLSTADYNNLDHFAQLWFREVFGMRIKKKITVQETPKKKGDKNLTNEGPAKQRQKTEDKLEIRKEKKQARLERLAPLKRDKMEELHTALRNLDAGETIEEFVDETRRVVYFDEESQQYFVEKMGKRKNVGTGDIVSDYAWGIKYFPDSYMADPAAYRTLAKRILVNETRRDLEKIHNYELARSTGFEFKKFRERFMRAGGKEKQALLGEGGFIGEVVVRELLSRIGQNYNLNFIVSRATIQEDREFKYDFKIRVKKRLRGIDVQSRPTNKSIGFDLKTVFDRKRVFVSKTTKGIKTAVDEILILKVPGKDIVDAVQQWFEAGEPSGGPEQFLSLKLKKAILKAVTEKLVDIPQEVFDKIE